MPDDTSTTTTTTTTSSTTTSSTTTTSTNTTTTNSTTTTTVLGCSQCISRSGVPLGCFDWSNAQEARMCGSGGLGGERRITTRFGQLERLETMPSRHSRSAAASPASAMSTAFRVSPRID